MMTDARLCIGNYAARPYCLGGLNLRVYCVEELCYALKENAFLLDVDLMSDELVDFLDRDCGLEDLARELHEMIHKKGSFSAFVSRILEYTGFFDAQSVQKAVQTLKQGAGLNVLEKRKLRIDSLTEQKKYLAAVREYDALLDGWGGAEDGHSLQGTGLYGSIMHNKGSALAGLMRYREAAECFFAAYGADESEESLKCYLAAKRMELNDHDYITFVASLPEYSQTVLMLEKEVEQLNSQWEKEADHLRMAGRERLREDDFNGYLDDNRRVTEALKAGYRSMTE